MTPPLLPIFDLMRRHGLLCYLLGQLARLVRAVEDLVVEHGEVEGEPQPDGVSRLHLGLTDLESVLVGFLRVVNDSYKILVGIKTHRHTHFLLEYDQKGKYKIV